jgi:hypothetical protein
MYIAQNSKKMCLSLCIDGHTFEYVPKSYITVPYSDYVITFDTKAECEEFIQELGLINHDYKPTIKI